MTHPFKKGDRVACMYDSGVHILTTGKVYTVVKDEEPGIFADLPYVTTNSDNPRKNVVSHARRFELYEGDGDKTTSQELEQLREQRRKELSS